MATTALSANVTQPNPNSKRTIETDYRSLPCTEKDVCDEVVQSRVISQFSQNPFPNALNGKNTGNRVHMYVNLPTHLTVTRRNPIPPTTASSKSDFKNHNANASPPTVDSIIDLTVQEVEQPQRKSTDTSPTDDYTITRNDKDNNFRWSPRCPPDGAAFYEISPPPSSVSSSPVSKSLPETKLLDIDYDNNNNIQTTSSVAATTSHDGIPSVQNAFEYGAPPSLSTLGLQCEVQTPFSSQLALRSTDPTVTTTHVTWSMNNATAVCSPSTSLAFSSSSTASSVLQKTGARFSPENRSCSSTVVQTTTAYSSPLSCTTPIPSVATASESNTRNKHVTGFQSPDSSTLGKLTSTSNAYPHVPPSNQSSHPTVMPTNSNVTPPSPTALSGPHHDHTDGRTVVPWDVGTRDLAPSDKVIQEAVSAAFAHSSSVSTDIPQWIPPVMTTSRQRLLSCPPGNHSEVEKGELRATRPTCLFKTSQLSTEQVLQAINGSGAQSDRGARRHHTTSNFVISPSSPCVKSPFNAEHRFFRGQDQDDTALRHKEYQPLFPVEAEWLRAQQRSKLYSATSPSTIGHTENFTNGAAHFHRQISAGSTFNAPTPLADNGLRKARTNSGTTTKYRDGSSSQHSPTVKQQPIQLYTQTHAGGKLVSEEELLFAQTLRSPKHSPESYQSTDSSRFVFLDHPSMYEMQNSQFVRNQMMMQNEFQSSSMTQSVIFPHSTGGGWVASKHVPSTEKPMLSASSRQRRSKGGGLSRAQSHRSMNPPMREFGPEDPSVFDLYQRSFSQTVPATQIVNGDVAWPPVMAHWHHRQHAPFMSNNDLHEMKQSSESRRVRRSKTGRSSHDISHFEGMKLAQASQHHHHSTSAISDRLEDHTWFHPNVSRAEAERLLHPMREGSFLVRQSDSKQSGYSLSIRRESDVLHMKIIQNMESGHFVLGEYSQPYPSIVAMIHRYRRSLLPVRGTTPILLRYAVENRYHTDSVRRA